jgi:NADH-quinone oxidoreductase subunit M
MDHILSIVLCTPLAGLLVLLFLPASNPRLIKLWANIAAFAGFLVSLPPVFQFDRTRTWAFEEQATGFPASALPTTWASTGWASCSPICRASLRP